VALVGECSIPRRGPLTADATPAGLEWLSAHRRVPVWGGVWAL